MASDVEVLLTLRAVYSQRIPRHQLYCTRPKNKTGTWHSTRQLRGFCCFLDDKTHPKKPSSGYLRQFRWVQMDINHPKRPSNRPVLGFGQNGPNHRTPRTPLAFAKKGVRWCFVRGFCRKRTTIEHLERSGEFKGVREGREVFDGRGGLLARSRV